MFYARGYQDEAYFRKTTLTPLLRIAWRLYRIQLGRHYKIYDRSDEIGGVEMKKVDGSKDIWKVRPKGRDGAFHMQK